MDKQQELPKLSEQMKMVKKEANGRKKSRDKLKRSPVFCWDKHPNYNFETKKSVMLNNQN